jgi:hypothetical protein
VRKPPFAFPPKDVDQNLCAYKSWLGAIAKLKREDGWEMVLGLPTITYCDKFEGESKSENEFWTTIDLFDDLPELTVKTGRRLCHSS